MPDSTPAASRPAKSTPGGFFPMPESQIHMRQLTVDLEHGLHVVPCSEISKLARSFDGQVRLIREEFVADAKSMLDLLQLNAPRGTVLVLEVEGDGADLLADRFDALFRNGFHSPR